METDLRITGMDCDADGIWAVTHAHATRSSELYRIVPSTGAATLIGATGIPSGVVESLSIDRTQPHCRAFLMVRASESLPFLYRSPTESQ